MEELEGWVDFEVIAINNYTDKVRQPEDKGGDYVKSFATENSNLKYLEYLGRLSHWNAKNFGVKESSGDLLWFCDAHCIVGNGALRNAVLYYRENYERLNGTLHLPLTYHILESKKLIYNLQVKRDAGFVHYTFCGYRDSLLPYEVPCMSTCGMLMSRALYDELLGWPELLGIYGGGENYVNFVMAVLGKKKWIMPGRPLYHHADKRGYSYNYDDYVKNRAIAAYCSGGEEWATRYIKSCKGSETILRNILTLVIENNFDRRKYIKQHQTITLNDWLIQWGF